MAIYNQDVSSNELVCRRLVDVVETAKLAYYTSKTLRTIEHILGLPPLP